MKKYYTLTGQERDGCDFTEALWGSYSRAEVEAEREFYTDEYKRLKIICTDHAQKAIDTKRDSLNA